MKKTWLLILIVLFNAINVSASDTTIVKSPDRNIVFKLYSQELQLYFTVSYKDEKVLNPSPLNLESNSQSATHTVSIEKQPTLTHVDNSYSVFGAHSTARNNYNGAVIHLIGSSNALM